MSTSQRSQRSSDKPIVNIQSASTVRSKKSASGSPGNFDPNDQIEDRKLRSKSDSTWSKVVEKLPEIASYKTLTRSALTESGDLDDGSMYDEEGNRLVRDPSAIKFVGDFGDDGSIARRNTRARRKTEAPPEKPYVPGPAVFVWVEVGEANRFILNSQARCGVIKRYILPKVQPFTQHPLEKHEFDLISSQGVLLNLQELNDAEFCGEFEGRETYIPVVSALDDDGFFKVLECIHPTLEAKHPKVHSVILEMFDHSEQGRLNLQEEREKQNLLDEKQRRKEERDRQLRPPMSINATAAPSRLNTLTP